LAVSRRQSPEQRTTFCSARSVLRIVAPAHRGGELGFIFHPDHSGRGYAIEAAGVVLGVAFGEFGLHRVTGSCDARNLASARLMERLGMRREAHFHSNEYVKDEWCDELVYAILREEWVVR
jgi:RimJ/RimL family protein N-acetyltransferase